LGAFKTEGKFNIFGHFRLTKLTKIMRAKINHTITTGFLLICFCTLLFVSCADRNGNKTDAEKRSETIQQYDGVTIDVEISNKNYLAILLAKDGTINRKGTGVVDSTDKAFFMGITDTKPFDSLMNGISTELLSYCNKPGPRCDSLRQNYKVKISFGNNVSVCEIDYCVNGTMDDLPRPIREFIEKAIAVTDPWYQTQKETMLKNKTK